MAMILNSQYPDGNITADVLLGEELLDDGIQEDLKKLNALVASRKTGNREQGAGRAITPEDLIGNGRGGDLDDLAAADRRLTKLLKAGNRDKAGNREQRKTVKR